MDIHVVQPGDTLYRIAQQYGVPMSRLLLDNRPPDPNRLAVGQSLVVQYPRETLILRPEETLAQAAQRGGISLRQLLRNNPQLEGGENALPGQELVLSFQQEKEGTLSVGGYAYPEIDPALLRQTLPFLTTMAPFTYGITPQGGLVPLDDQALIDAAKSMRVRPILHLSTLTQEGTFSNELAHTVLTDGAVQDRLAASLLETIQQKGYRGLDVDFEFVYPEDASAYAAFIARMRESLSPLGLPVFVALVPKTSADQRGDLYEGHDYRLLGEAADFVFLMTYEWGYTYGPPMAVAPLRNVELVVEYALSEIPAEKIWMGIPNYGYDWTLPFRQGDRAQSISNQEAVALAVQNRVAIRFDQAAQSPWFRYVDGQGREHEVWFEDARSIRAKLELARSRGLYGVGYWNLMRPFPQNWALLNSLYEIPPGDETLS